MARRTNDFQTIRSEGGLLPPDLLRRVLDPKEKLPGTRSEDYGLPQGERINEMITQSWNRLRKHWTEFRAAAANLSESEPGTGLTNDKWNLPLLRELAFGLLPTSAGPELGGRTYAINRFYGPVPVHLIGCGLSLDRRAAGVRGAAAVNPHGLVQEFLNRSPGHVWAIVSNGLCFRILRDNQALSRQSFLEFDLEAMFAGEVYSDFVLLWLIAHATRFAPREGDRPDTSWLEQWTKLADEQGTRALGDLRGGVEKAIQVLGEGFTSHPKNAALRDALRTGQVPLADFHGQLLRVVYRLIFLFVAEDRTLDGQPLLHPRGDSDAARLGRERFAAYYSTDHLRELASKIKGSRHGDLWRQFQLLVGALSGDEAFAAVREHLALPALGSFLWNPASTAALNDAELTNHDFLEALRHLAFTRQGKVLRPVDYRNLGAEELGGVYESLLSLTPQLSADGARFTFSEFAGNERKTSGSYYTPDSLVQCLLDSALDPVVAEAIKGKTGAEAEKAILALKVCDPAVGSGHFLVGAAHRLARHLARVRALAQGESEPSPLLYQHALRDVIGHCLYGVDVNPMAAELCRMSLWLEALEPGKPLSFLDHHIRVGNSLLGTTPELIAAGLPDDAFTAIEGDDKKICSALKKRNKQEREGQRDMLHLMVAEPAAEYNSIATRTRSIEEVPDDTIDEIQRKAEQFHRLVVSPEYQHAQQVADAWCAAFLWKKQANTAYEPITTDTIRCLEADTEALTPAQRREVERLASQYQLFHWHLAFPEVFAQGGFDCVLGNPPWERININQKEWFASRGSEVSAATNAARRTGAIALLEDQDPQLWNDWQDALRVAGGYTHFLRDTGRFPLCARGDINTYAVFAELARSVLNRHGRLGCILPSGLATDLTTQEFFNTLMDERSLVSFYEFENEGFFAAGRGHMLRFALTTIAKGQPQSQWTKFLFKGSQLADLNNPERCFELRADEILLMNPNTRTCPVFTLRKDAEIVSHVYRHVPVLVLGGERATGWNVELRRMIHLSDDAALLRTKLQLEEDHWELVGNRFVRGGERMVPVVEAKMVYQYNHRHGDFRHVRVNERPHQLPETPIEQLLNPSYVTLPFYWVPESELDQRLADLWNRDWILGWRDVTDSRASVRTVVSATIPRVAVTGSHQIFVREDPQLAGSLCAALSSFALDFVARQKVASIHLTYAVLEQLPIPLPSAFSRPIAWSGSTQTFTEWLLPRLLELTYTAWDLEPFARDCGWSGPPFCWDDTRRFLLRCELDAAFFHLYLPTTPEGGWKPARRAEGVVHDETPEQLADLQRHFPTPRDAVSYIMDTFPIVKSKDEKKYNGDYRTKRVISETYDAMQEAIRTSQPYQTRLDPPPADPRCCHPPRVTIIDLSDAAANVLPFRRVRPDREDRYKTCVPLLSVKAAAGGFGEDQDVDFDDWVEIKASLPLRRGMFVAQVIGHSMEPVIPDGKYCLFQFMAPALKNDMIGLFQLHTAEDPELGGRFTIKRLKISTQPDPEGGLRRVTTLVPENPAFEPIPVEADDVKFVAEFLEVLQALVSDAGEDQ